MTELIDAVKIYPTSTKYRIYKEELSEWQCQLFGGDPSTGIVWRPNKGKEPNWFWRKMQYLCFGNKWVKG